MAKVDITRFRGDTDPIVFNISKTGKPVNLTGSVFTLSVSREQFPATASYTFQITGVSSSPLTGQVTFTPILEQVDLLGTYFYDVQMTTGLAIKTLVSGKIMFNQDITK